MTVVYQFFILLSTAFDKPLKIFHKTVEFYKENTYNSGMEREMQNRITADIVTFCLPRYVQIPEVGLYLEQVVRYINTQLSPLGEPELTPSMVSNYVKQKLVPAPQKKLYTAEHLARLLFIAVVKPVVPLEGLRLMFSIQEECYPLQTAYDYFCDEFENIFGAAFGIAPAVEGLGETESDAKDLLRSTISATVNKVCLDRYLEEYRKRREQAETPEGPNSV
jgi:DNA-binding transcriptional MerR regulator